MTGGPEARAFFGRVVTGKGVAVGFTATGWVRDGFLRLVGIAPFPGTLNLMVEEPDSRVVWDAIRALSGIRLPAPNERSCDARLYPVVVGGRVEGAIVLPEVPGYPPDQVEIIAAEGLRAALGLKDGDRVEVVLAGRPLR